MSARGLCEALRNRGVPDAHAKLLQRQAETHIRFYNEKLRGYTEFHLKEGEKISTRLQSQMPSSYLESLPSHLLQK